MTKAAKSKKSNKSAYRRPWTQREDQALESIVSGMETKNWTKVAKALCTQIKIKGRTGKQCRERWHNHLDTGINKESWTRREERLLFEIHSKIGNKWAEISKTLAGRTENSVKNHFYSTLRRLYRQIYGQNPSRYEMHVRDQELTRIAIQRLQEEGAEYSSQEKFEEGFDLSLDEMMPVEQNELFISGRQIALPPNKGLVLLEEEFPVEFEFGDNAQWSGEVFMMPLSPLLHEI